MGIVATLLPDSASLARVVQAVHGRHEVVPCERWADVSAACEDSAVHLAVLDLFADGRANFDQVRALKIRFARVTLVAYVAPAPGRWRDLFDAGRAGVDGLLIAGQDDSPAQLRAVMDQAEARGVAGLLRQKLVTWGRLIVAAQMLEDPFRSADSVARILDFPSGSAFRNSCQRYLGASPHEIRERGGAQAVVEQFVDAITAS